MPLLPDLRGPGPDLPLCGPYRPTRSSVPPSSGPPAPMGSQAVGPPLPRQNISDNFFERLHVQELKDPPPLKKTGNIQCKYWLQKAVITNAIKARHLVGPMPQKPFYSTDYRVPGAGPLPAAVVGEAMGTALQWRGYEKPSSHE